MNAFTIVNITLCSVFALCYVYQFVYMFISYFSKKTAPDTDTRHNIAVLICARNEEVVISRLLDSLNAQDYPHGNFRVFVAADNCTDKTADVARAHGATVFERFDKEKVGKGYALGYLIENIRKSEGESAFDAYLVFDADNVVYPNFLTEINKTLALGYDVVTSYRAPLNYADNWLTAGHGLCFLRDMVLLNRARMSIGSSSFISGTGYAFTNRLIDSFGGVWPFTTLTEDCEFTVYSTVNGIKMGYSDSARFLDEQPIKFRQSWNQRLRWCKGGIQVFLKYIKKLVSGLFSRKFLACLDITMCMAPAYIISVGITVFNTVGTVIALALGIDPVTTLITICLALGGVYLAFLVFGISLTVTEWRQLGGSAPKKILYMFTFPIFMLSFLPITCAALFKRKIVWQPTERKA